MNRILSSLFLVWVFSSCGGIDFSDENEVRRILHLAELKKGLVPKETEGRIHLFRENDDRPFEGWIADYHENGKLKSLEHYESGVPSGPFRTWHLNGVPESEGLFRDTREHGVWTLWFDSGRKREMKIFQEGRLEGPYAWWHPNGQLRAEGNYKEGKKEGIWVMYDSLGKEVECLTYANGESTD